VHESTISGIFFSTSLSFYSLHPPWWATRISGYGKISAAAKGQTKWLLMVDSDEFVFAASPSATVIFL
jgi:hypothetical protein